MCKTLGSSSLAFTKDNQRLIAVQPCGTVNVIELSEKSIKLAATIEPPTPSTLSYYEIIFWVIFRI